MGAAEDGRLVAERRQRKSHPNKLACHSDYTSVPLVFQEIRCIILYLWGSNGENTE